MLGAVLALATALAPSYFPGANGPWMAVGFLAALATPALMLADALRLLPAREMKV